MSATAKKIETNPEQLARQAIEAALRAGADQADAVTIDSVSVAVGTRLGKQETLERAESVALGLRVWCGKKIAIVSSSDRAADTVKELAARAVAMAKASTEDPYASLAEEALWARETPDLDLYDANEPSVAWLLEKAKEAEETALEGKGITNSKGADAGYGSSRFTLATSKGFLRSYGGSHLSLSVEIVAGKGEDMQRDYDYATVCHREDLPTAKQIGEEAARRAAARLHPKSVPSKQVPVLFDPRAGRSLLSAFASAISGAAIARGTSFLKNSMGETIFPKSFNIIDDPLRRRGLGSHPFDSEGVHVEKRRLIKNGMLQTWLLDLRTAAQLNLKTTGSASRGIASPPSPSTSNLYLEPGKKTKEELLSSMKEGLYIMELSGMGTNLVTGDYSQGAAGFWIENGEIAYPVAESTIAGNLKDMFLRMTPANDLEFTFATNVPTLLIEGMTVAGS